MFEFKRNTYLVSVLALAVQLEVFAHLGSELVDVGSAWREVIVNVDAIETKVLLSRKGGGCLRRLEGWRGCLQGWLEYGGAALQLRQVD